MSPETERLIQNELRVRRTLRMPGQFLVGIFLVLAGLIFAAGIYHVIADLIAKLISISQMDILFSKLAVILHDLWN